VWENNPTPGLYTVNPNSIPSSVRKPGIMLNACVHCTEASTLLVAVTKRIKNTTQLDSLDFQSFHIIQLKHDHHLDLTRATAAPYANPVDTRVRVMEVSISELPEFFPSGHSGEYWVRNSLVRDCYIGGLANSAII
jgi:hypothetical protein